MLKHSPHDKKCNKWQLIFNANKISQIQWYWEIFQCTRNIVLYTKCNDTIGWKFKKKIPANCIMTLDAPDGVSDTLKNFSNRVWSGNIFFLKWINQENK